MPSTEISLSQLNLAARALATFSTPLIIAIVVAAHANAAPYQPGVTSPQGSQPGVTSTPETTPPADEPTSEPEFLPGYTPSPEVQWSQPRTIDDYRHGRQQPSTETIYYDNTPAEPTVQAPPALRADPEPAPMPVPTVQRTRIAPTETPDGYILVGAEPIPYDPNLIDPRLARQISNTGQDLQAQGGNWLLANGLADAPRADRIAAGTATGIAAGAATGFLASLAPTAVIAGTGAALGGLAGLAATTPIVWAGPLGWVSVPGAGALAGAGAGALLSTPIVVSSTAIGALFGGLLGAGLAGGESEIVEEPAPAQIIPPTPDSVPAFTPDATQSVLFGVPDDVRGAIASDPVGAQVVDAVDTAVQGAAPVVEQAVSDSSLWSEPVYEAAQGFTSTVLEQPGAHETVTAVQDAAASVLDQANAALSDLQAALVPA